MSETLEKPGAARDAGFAKAEGAPISALVQLRQSSAWKWATPAQREVLQRIAAQRDQRLLARLTRARQAALLASAERVDANAPLLQRLVMFARLHPTTLASAGVAAVLMIGPRRLLRVVRGSLPTLLPMLLKLKR